MSEVVKAEGHPEKGHFLGPVNKGTNFRGHKVTGFPETKENPKFEASVVQFDVDPNKIWSARKEVKEMEKQKSDEWYALSDEMKHKYRLSVQAILNIINKNIDSILPLSLTTGEGQAIDINFSLMFPDVAEFEEKVLMRNEMSLSADASELESLLADDEDKTTYNILEGDKIIAELEVLDSAYAELDMVMSISGYSLSEKS